MDDQQKVLSQKQDLSVRYIVYNYHVSVLLVRINYSTQNFISEAYDSLENCFNPWETNMLYHVAVGSVVYGNLFAY